MKPDYRVLAGTRDITAVVRSQLVSLTVVDEAGLQTDTCEIVLNDPEGRIALPRRGVALEVSIGFEGAPLVGKGKYVVDEVELAGEPVTLTIRGKAADMEGTISAAKEQHTKSWSNKTLQEIFGDLARSAHLNLKIHPSLAGVVRKQWDQTSDSDGASALRLARAEGGEMKIAGGCMIIYPQGTGMSAGGHPMPTVTVNRKDVAPNWKMTIADREKYAAVAASYWDPQLGKQINQVAGDPDGLTFVLRGQYPDPTSAMSAAKSRLGAIQRGAATLHFEMAGKPELAAECPIVLVGFLEGVAGGWIATHVEHAITTAGYTARVDAEVPGVTI